MVDKEVVRVGNTSDLSEAEKEEEMRSVGLAGREPFFMCCEVSNWRFQGTLCSSPLVPALSGCLLSLENLERDSVEEEIFDPSG